MKRPVKGSERFHIYAFCLRSLWLWAVLVWLGAMYWLFGARFSLMRRSRGLGNTEGPRGLVMSSSNCNEFTPKRWLTHPHEHGLLYDLVVYDYSADNNCAKFITEGPHTRLIHKPKTYKWPAVYHMFHDAGDLPPSASSQVVLGPTALAGHDWFFLSDDDIDIPGDARGIALLAEYCLAGGLYICQPSLSAKSAVNMDITGVATRPSASAQGGDAGDGVAAAAADDDHPASGDNHHLRITGFVEQMAPLFTRDALMQFLPYFRDLTHGWGIDCLWSDLSQSVLGRPVGVVDAVQIDHMRPSGVSALYKRVGGIAKAEEERALFKQRYRISDDVFRLVEKGHAGEGDRKRVELGSEAARRLAADVRDMQMQAAYAATDAAG